jgi:polar amino acid transport system permease protein
MRQDFFVVWSERALLLNGLVNTIALSVVATIAAVAFGMALTLLLIAPRSNARFLFIGFVDTMRCIPFLLFAYIVYYGLPSIGLNLNNWTAGLVALSIYNAAYMAEILRGAWMGLTSDAIDAGYAFGFTGLSHFRRIALPPLLLAAAPVVGNQVIQIVKDSAFLTVIALPELTHAASSIQSRHYIPFAAFVTAVLLYWLLCLAIEATVACIGRVAEVRR